jgi:hypothetical protein
MANYDEELRFAQGGDTGEDDSNSIQPIADDERLWHVVLDRTPENLRLRTEILRTAVKQLKFESDYQRGGLTLASTGTFALTQHADGYEVSSTAELRIVPPLVPNEFQSGGRKTAFPSGANLAGARLFAGSNSYLGTLGVNDLWIFADPGQTGQRAYADGTDMNDLSVKSVGANDITFELAVDGGLGPGTVQFDVVDGVPTRHISVRYGDGTTLGQLRDAINNDRVGGSTQSQGGGTWGVGEMVRATTTVNPATTVLTGANLLSCAVTTLQGGYDAEVHVVTPAQLSTFFGVSANRLQDGECLVLAYPSGPVQSGGIGGRRQSLQDLPGARTGSPTDNTGRLAAGAGMLVNGGLHPEKIPGAIPIGRMIQTGFRFIDGTILLKGTALDTPGTSLSLGESIYTILRLAGSGGASFIHYDGSSNWNPDLLVAPTNVPAGTVEAAIDAIVDDLASMVSFEAGTRRIGGEVITGSASTGNLAHTLNFGSLRQQLDEMLNYGASEIQSGGINSRVSEYGHRMKGHLPLEKVYSEAGGTGGAILTRTVLNTPSDVNGSTQKLDYESITLQPIAYDLGGGATLTAAMPLDHGGGAGATQVRLTPITGTQLTTLTTVMKSALGVVDDAGAPLYNAIVSIQGATGGTDNNGYYLVTAINSVSGVVSLLKLDGTAPNFSTTTFTAATMTFYNTAIKGNDQTGHRFRGYHFTVGAMAVYGLPDSGAVVLRLYDPDNLAASGGFASMELTPNNAKFKVGQTVGGHSIEKDTNNILINADYVLLKGIEAGGAGAPAPVDASNSHHHGENYTRYYFPTNTTTPLAFNAVGSSPNLTQLPQYINALSGVPSGYHVVGIVVDILTETLVTAAAAGTVFEWGLIANPGTTNVAANQRTVFRLSGYKATAGAETYRRDAQVVIPTNTSGQCYFQVGAPGGSITGITQASTTVTLTLHAMLLAPN